MPESGWLMLKGMAAEVTFYKTLFDKLGVKADGSRSANTRLMASPSPARPMSPAFREEVTDPQRHVCHDRRRSPNARGQLDAARQLIDNGPYTPAAAEGRRAH